MPSTITHTYISLDTLKKIKSSPKKIIENYIEDYKTFAQGMDILYFYHIFSLKKSYVECLGHKFHNYKTNEIFKYIIEQNKRNKSNMIFTFLVGLITHYVADSTIHPYVNYLAKNDNPLLQRDKHFEIETVLDNYMVNKNNGYYKKFKNYKLQFNNKRNQEIINLINNIFEKFFNTKNIGKKYYHSIKEMKFTFRFIRFDQFGIKRKIFKLIDKNKLKVRRTKYLSYNFDLNNLDFYLNSNNKEWYNIKDKSIKSNLNFEDLYKNVVEKASNIINNLYDYIYLNKEVDLDKLLENKSYSTGLVLK